ncbi:vomeronasal type-2 receptor 26-like [Pleurodeles waltl]|uniref:vomeronasal type-2 receptor 26-like n=1 Tax=Pleurodeles waltl TaxID=8319 RepID=UPI0037095342
MSCPDGEWPTEKKDGCQKKSLVFLSYEDPLGSTLASLSLIGALLAFSTLILFFRNAETPIVRANNRSLSYLLLSALIFCFLCSLLFIGYPTTISCMLRQTTFGIIFVLCISCILGKTVLVLIAFKATQPNSSTRMWLSSGLLNILVFICTCIQVVICIIWLTVSPPFREMNQKSQLGKVVIECNEGSPFAFWCMLGYMGALTTCSLVVAFLARALPDNFNEAKLITFSMLIFAAVWVSFIPVYLSTKGSHMVAVEVFAILCSSSGLLGCIFFPKCYIILLRPEMNTKEALMGKQQAHRTMHKK